MDKQLLKGHNHKLHSLWYGPYTILDCIRKDDYRLDLPPHLGIHDMLNVNNLKLFEPPLLEETVTVQHPMDNISYFQPRLLHDQIINSKTRITRHQQHASYLVGWRGQTWAQDKCMTTKTVQQWFPELLTKARMLLDLNREELYQ
jgi:hypothetical protein